MVTVMMHHMFTKDNLDAPKYNRHLNSLGSANSTYMTISVWLFGYFMVSFWLFIGAYHTHKALFLFWVHPKALNRYPKIDLIR